MMKNHYRNLNSRHYSLGELVEIVSSCAKNSREAVAAVADMLESGRVQIQTHGKLKRVRVES